MIFQSSGLKTDFLRAHLSAMFQHKRRQSLTFSRGLRWLWGFFLFSPAKENTLKSLFRPNRGLGNYYSIIFLTPKTAMRSQLYPPSFPSGWRFSSYTANTTVLPNGRIPPPFAK